MRLPRSDLRPEGHCVIDPAVETLSFENAQLDFGHVQPISLLEIVLVVRATVITVFAPVSSETPLWVVLFASGYAFIAALFPEQYLYH